MDIDLDQLVARYRPVIGFKVKKALGAGNVEWEDIVNEILTQGIEKIKSGEFRGESSVGTFLYTITSRRIVDYIRQKTRVLREAPEAHVPVDPQEQVEKDERAEFLADAIKKLRPKYREVLHLYYYRDLSREEVARALGITPARVSDRVNYAQKLLRKSLGKRHFPFFDRTGD